jgi:CBS domain-containing protein
MPQRSVRSIIENQNLLTASPETTVAEAAGLMKRSRVGAIMVVERGRLAGIFTERDALFRVVAEGRDPQATRLADVMTRDCQTIDADKPLGHALHMMYEGRFRHVPVVENGKPLGIVSARDALGPELLEFEAELVKREHIREIL